MGAVNSISSWFDRGGRLKIEDIADVIVGMLTRSIAVETSIAKVRVEIPAHPEATLAFTPLAPARAGRAAATKKAGSAKAKPTGVSRNKAGNSSGVRRERGMKLAMAIWSTAMPQPLNST